MFNVEWKDASIVETSNCNDRDQAARAMATMIHERMKMAYFDAFKAGKLPTGSGSKFIQGSGCSSTFSTLLKQEAWATRDGVKLPNGLIAHTLRMNVGSGDEDINGDLQTQIEYRGWKTEE